MEGVLVALAILACPVGMGLMMLFWWTRHGRRAECLPPARDRELEALDRKQQALVDELARTARG